MINSKHLLQVSAAWISIVYVICYAGVALSPGLREGFMKYALHNDITLGQSYLTLGSFVAGLVIWNVIAAIAVWLFAALSNKIKQ